MAYALPTDRPTDRPAGQVVARVLKKSLKKARTSGAVALASDDRSDWHRLRKDLKRFRYLLSGFEALYPPGAAKPVERELADDQGWLGRTVAAIELQLTADGNPFLETAIDRFEATWRNRTP